MSGIMRLAVGLSLAASVAISAPAKAEEMVSGWLASPQEHGCAATTIFNDQSDFYISYVPSRDNVRINFNNPKFKSLEKDKEYDIKVYFKTGDRKLDDGWGEIKFFGLFDSAGKSLGVSSQNINGDDFLKDFASNDTIAFFLGDRIIDYYPLKNSSAVVAALRKCANEVERKNPSDPFADE